MLYELNENKENEQFELKDINPKILLNIDSFIPKANLNDKNAIFKINTNLLQI